jgi:hypothetical protein
MEHRFGPLARVAADHRHSVQEPRGAAVQAVDLVRMQVSNRELKRRTRVATLFPNDASLLRLITAVLMEISEDWETNKRYVTFETK